VLPTFAFVRPDFPLTVFFEDEVPRDVKSRWMLGNHVLASFFSMFHKPLYEIDTLVGLSIPTCRAHVEGSVAHLEPPELPSPLFPPGFQLAFKGDPAELDVLLEGAAEIGEYLWGGSVSLRFKVCSGLAVIEIAQLIKNWIRDDTGIIPHCELAMAIISSWQKVAEPTSILIPRSVAIIPATLKLDPGVFQSVYNRAVARLKEMLARELEEPWLGRLSAATNLSDILAVFHTDCSVPLDEVGETTCRLTARRCPLGGVDLALVWDEEPEDRARARGNVMTAWIRLLGELKRGARGNIVDFVYEWMRAGPFGPVPGTFGLVLMVALLIVTGVVVDSPLPHSLELECLALIARGKNEFFSAMGLASIQLKTAPEYPSVAKLLPNLHVRLQAFRRYPFEASTVVR
jgi:hypothetical protein